MTEHWLRVANMQLIGFGMHKNNQISILSKTKWPLIGLSHWWTFHEFYIKKLWDKHQNSDSRDKNHDTTMPAEHPNQRIILLLMLFPVCSHSFLNSILILTRSLHNMFYYCMAIGCSLPARTYVDHQGNKDVETQSPSPWEKLSLSGAYKKNRKKMMTYNLFWLYCRRKAVAFLSSL